KSGRVVRSVSWSAPRAGPAARPRACLCRPSTTLLHSAPQFVDGRAKPGRDAGATDLAPNPSPPGPSSWYAWGQASGSGSRGLCVLAQDHRLRQVRRLPVQGEVELDRDERLVQAMRLD